MNRIRERRGFDSCQVRNCSFLQLSFWGLLDTLSPEVRILLGVLPLPYFLPFAPSFYFSRLPLFTSRAFRTTSAKTLRSYAHTNASDCSPDITHTPFIDPSCHHCLTVPRPQPSEVTTPPPTSTQPCPANTRAHVLSFAVKRSTQQKSWRAVVKHQTQPQQVQCPSSLTWPALPGASSECRHSLVRLHLIRIDPVLPHPRLHVMVNSSKR